MAVGYDYSHLRRLPWESLISIIEMKYTVNTGVDIPQFIDTNTVHTFRHGGELKAKLFSLRTGA